MSGTVRYRRLAEPRFFDELGAPLVMRYRPGRTIVACDSRLLIDDPAVLTELDRISNTLVSNFDQTLTRTPSPGMICDISRPRIVPGGQLVDGELVDEHIHLEIARRLISEELTTAIAAAATRIGHYLARRA